jgi:hypothetical protein
MSAVPPNAEVNSEVDGLLDQVIWAVQPCFQKYFCFHLTQITGLSRVGFIESRSFARVVPALRRDPSVSAIALIATPCVLVSAVERMPSLTSNASGYGSQRSLGRENQKGCGLWICFAEPVIGWAFARPVGLQ